MCEYYSALKWHTLQPPTLQKYHQFTVFRDNKKKQSCVWVKHPTHAVGEKEPFFINWVHYNSPIQWKRIAKQIYYPIFYFRYFSVGSFGSIRNFLKLLLDFLRSFSGFGDVEPLGSMALFFLLKIEIGNWHWNWKLEKLDFIRADRVQRATIQLTSSTEIRGVIISSGNRHGFRWCVWLFFHFL